MGNRSKDSTATTNMLVAGLAGMLVGRFLAQSNAEYDEYDEDEDDLEEDARDDRADLEFITGLVLEALEAFSEDPWWPEKDTENAWRDQLAAWLEEYFGDDLEVEVEPATDHGKPDILIGQTVVVELKRHLGKGDIQRCVGQWLDYSQRWITLVATVGVSGSAVQRLEDRLSRHKDFKGWVLQLTRPKQHP